MKNKQKLVTLFIISILLFQNLHSVLAKNEKQELSSFKSEIRIKPKTKKPNYQYKDDKVLVKYKEDKINLKKSSGQKKALSIESVRGLKELKSFKNSNTKILQADGSADKIKIIEELEKDPNVEYAVKNAVRYPLAIPNDTFFSYQWALNNTGQTFPASTGGSTSGTADADMDAAETWDTENSANQEIVVAVIDTGARLTHEDLAANIWTNADEIAGNGIDDDANGYVDDVHGWDFKDNDNDPSDSVFNYCYQYSGQICIDQEDVSGHGTFISGIIAAVHNNAKGISGVSSKNKIKIMPLRFDLDTATELEAIEYAKNNGAKVINASYGAGTPDLAEKNAIEAFPGVVVAAAGNDATNNETSHFYPSDYTSSNIISVAATDQNDTLAAFSNYGNISVDLGAPGQNLASTYHSSDTTYATADGTSFAAPYVSGAAAMALSKNPALNITALKSNIINSGDCSSSLSGKTLSGRRLNLNNLLEEVFPTCPTSIYRFWSDTLQSHFYTASESEKNYVISHYPTNVWRYESVGFKAFLNQESNTSAVYRFWSDKHQGHFYTASESEKNYVISHYPTDVWRYEGIGFYVYPNKTDNNVAVYRFWSDTLQGHFYTASESEKNYVISHYPTNVWRYEGIAFYVPK